MEAFLIKIILKKVKNKFGYPNYYINLAMSKHLNI
jgi:hypothetical protein